MIAEQLDAIEEAVGFRLPVAYRRVAAEMPFRPIGRESIDWFFGEPDAVIGETLHPQSASEQNLPRLPIGCLAIGLAPTGDTFVLDTRVDGFPVHCLSHETLEIEPEYRSFEAFVAEWLEAPKRIRAEAEALAVRSQAEQSARMRRAGRILLWWSLPFVAWMLFLFLIAWHNG